MKFMKAVAVVVLALVTNIVDGSHHPLRVVIDPKDEGPGCTEEEISKIYHVVNNHDDNNRQLVLGVNDRPCKDSCEGFPPGYCYMLFCNIFSGLRRLRGHHHKQSSKDLLEEVSLAQCVDDLVEVNNVMNDLLEEHISKGCKKMITGQRHFTCFDYLHDD